MQKKGRQGSVGCRRLESEAVRELGGSGVTEDEGGNEKERGGLRARC